MKLDYAKPAHRPPSREWRNVAVATSVAAVGCLVTAATMHALLGTAARELQLAIALTSVFLDAVALVTGIVAVTFNPRGVREIAALSTSIAYVLLLVAVLRAF